MRTHSKTAGFTFVELIVAIVVIAVLATIAYIGLNGALINARDSRRLDDMYSLTNALYLYKVQVGSLPDSVANTTSGWESSGVDPDQFISALRTSGVLGTVPVDPSNVPQSSKLWLGKVYNYSRYNAGSFGCDASRGNFYVLGVRDMESSGNPHPKSPGWKCGTRNWQTEFDWVTGAYEN